MVKRSKDRPKDKVSKPGKRKEFVNSLRSRLTKRYQDEARGSQRSKRVPDRSKEVEARGSHCLEKVNESMVKEEDHGSVQFREDAELSLEDEKRLRNALNNGVDDLDIIYRDGIAGTEVSRSLNEDGESNNNEHVDLIDQDQTNLKCYDSTPMKSTIEILKGTGTTVVDDPENSEEGNTSVERVSTEETDLMAIGEVFSDIHDACNASNEVEGNNDAIVTLQSENDEADFVETLRSMTDLMPENIEYVKKTACSDPEHSIDKNVNSLDRQKIDKIYKKGELHTDVYMGTAMEQDEHSVWSIATDTLTYTAEQPAENKEYQYQYSDPKGGRLKRWLLKNPKNLNPNNDTSTWDSHAHDKYMRVDSALKDTYDPSVDISTTYLWSDPATTSEIQDPNSWFRRGTIRLTDNSNCKGVLADDTPVRILFDTGATKAMINKKLYAKSSLLHSYPLFKFPTQKIRVANDQIIKVSEALKFPITIDGHLFEFVAFLMPFTTQYDFIVGNKNMIELEGNLDMGRCEFTFAKRSIPLRSLTNVSVPPGKGAWIEAELERVPFDLHDGMVVIKMNINKENDMLQTMRVAMRSGRILIKFDSARKDINLQFWKGKLLGVADMRSLGYANLTQETIYRLLEKRFIMYDDEGNITNAHTSTIDDLEIKEEEDGDIDNTKLIIKPKTKELIESTKQERDRQKELHKHEGDPYPWLDADDPRRTLTDKEIIKNYIDLSDSDLSESEKKKFQKIIYKYKEAFSL